MKKIYLALFILIITALIINCKAEVQKLGIDIPQNEEVITLGKVIESPEDYNGKTFLMKGTIVGQCASLCEFFFRDGTYRATIYPLGYQFPRLPIDRPVTIYVRANYGEQLVLSALGVEIH